METMKIDAFRNVGPSMIQNADTGGRRSISGDKWRKSVSAVQILGCRDRV